MCYFYVRDVSFFNADNYPRPTQTPTDATNAKRDRVMKSVLKVEL